jgi:hypothetical protein
MQQRKSWIKQKARNYNGHMKVQAQPRNVKMADSPVYVPGGWFQNAI